MMILGPGCLTSATSVGEALKARRRINVLSAHPSRNCELLPLFTRYDRTTIKLDDPPRI